MSTSHRRPRPGPRPAPPAPAHRRGPAPRRLWTALGAFVLAVLAALDVWLAFVHADRRHAAHRAATSTAIVIDPQAAAVTAAQRQAITAAKRRVPAILSYDYRHVDVYLAQAPTNTTGAYKARFTRLIETVVGPAATKNQVSTDAHIKAVGVIVAHTDQVQLLVFIDQTTSSTTSRTGRVETGRLTVTMARIGGDWLVADLTAV